MKKTIATCLLLLGSSTALAEEVRLVPADDSIYTRMCLAAADSWSALDAVIAESDLNSREVNQISCNGSPLMRFARNYALQRETAYSFTPTDSSIETRLCHAAVTSPQTFEQLRNEHFSQLANVGDTVSCNGMPLNQFINRYRVREITAAR